MNKVILMGRLTRDPEVRYSAGENALAIARYTLAVDRRFRRDGEATADFISCVVFGRGAEFAEKYFHQGIRIVVSGRIQTGSYTKEKDRRFTQQKLLLRSRNLPRAKHPVTAMQHHILSRVHRLHHPCRILFQHLLTDL